MTDNRTATVRRADPKGLDRAGEPHLDDARVSAYLERIGAARPDRPDAGHLRDLQLRHVRSVPFENLDIHSGKQIDLDARSLVDKIARDRRGGICYEVNGAFAALLTSLGYRVSLLSARVFLGDGFGPPFDHLALRVDGDEAWLVDVGFGRQIEFPLRLDERADQHGPGGVYRIADAADGDLDIYRDGELQYRAELRPRALADFATACWWHSNAPQAHFTQNLVCSLPTETGRITLSGRRLVVTEAGISRDTELPDGAVLKAYQEHFGIVLDRVPGLLPVPHREAPAATGRGEH
ncbi:arylamine N-acetyltransferase family protein [Streptomyces cadmiisoli]|uniref:arylamine N-acetyltransferase family protein n=1 Tax=Streptomyces cadmiisoli TaxID=2184053 RepID=UPI003D704BD3